MQKNKQTLEQFLASIERRAYRMACIATSSEDEAMDIVQDSMLSLVRRYSWKPQEEWKPLFFKILQSKIRDWYRRNAVRQRWRTWLNNMGFKEQNDHIDPFSSIPDQHSKDPEKLHEINDSMAALETALQSLSLRQQQVFLLRTWEGLGVAETALAMGCSEGSVKTHHSRAIQTLRTLLEGHWP